jgi:hypothetical protein
MFGQWVVTSVGVNSLHHTESPKSQHIYQEDILLHSDRSNAQYYENKITEKILYLR